MQNAITNALQVAMEMIRFKNKKRAGVEPAPFYSGNVLCDVVNVVGI